MGSILHLAIGQQNHLIVIHKQGNIDCSLAYDNRPYGVNFKVNFDPTN